MLTFNESYALFQKLIEQVSKQGYSCLNPSNPLLIELEKLMEANNQFFYLADALKIKIEYTSKRCLQMMGIAPEELNFYHFIEATHPDDMVRLSSGRTKLLKMAVDLHHCKDKAFLLSTNFRMRNPLSGYSNILNQCLVFNVTVPYDTVLVLKIHSNIDWHKCDHRGYHYYLGEDLSLFRFPDRQLLSIGNLFSEREYEIISLIATGLSSDEIAHKLFLSLHTVNTHRRNILKKSCKTSLQELINELKEC